MWIIYIVCSPLYTTANALFDIYFANVIGIPFELICPGNLPATLILSLLLLSFYAIFLSVFLKKYKKCRMYSAVQPTFVETVHISGYQNCNFHCPTCHPNMLVFAFTSQSFPQYSLSVNIALSSWFSPVIPSLNIKDWRGVETWWYGAEFCKDSWFKDFL